MSDRSVGHGGSVAFAQTQPQTQGYGLCEDSDVREALRAYRKLVRLRFGRRGPA
jgi:hypothetical protein